MLSHWSTKDPHGFLRTGKVAILVGGFSIGFLGFFRAQIFSRFDLLFGDRGDTRLVVFIHEHVFQAFVGNSAFLSPPFFYDVTKTLGFSDAYLLNQIIYAPLREVGVDPYLALLLTIMTLSVVGYGFLYALLRRFGRVSVVAAVFSSLIFTFANNLYANANHPQLFMIYYVPVVTYLAIYAITEIHEHKRLSLMAGGIAGLLYGFLFPTGFYMAWFFGLGLLIFAPIFIIISWHTVRTWFAADPFRIGMLGLALIDGFAVGLIPFALIYIPVYRGGGTRDFGQYLLSAPSFGDIANVGSNLIWADIVENIGLVSDRNIVGIGELSYALTPGFLFLVILSLLIGLRARYWDGDKQCKLTRAASIGGAVVCIALFLITIKVHELSLFIILYKFVPGAGAIRTGYRAMIVGNYFAAISVAIAINRLALMLSRHSVNVRASYAALFTLMVIALVEQVNLVHGSLVSRAFERAHFDRAHGAPTYCKSFYVASEPGQPPTIVQVDAMLIAQRVGIPTINGYSGVFPAGWELYDTNDANYEDKARAWAVSRGIDTGLCRFNLTNGTFVKVP